MPRHFVWAPSRHALLLALAPALAPALAHAAPGSPIADEPPAHCRMRAALVTEIAGTGELRTAYAHDGGRKGTHHVFSDWSGALSKRDDKGLYCEAYVLNRAQMWGPIAEAASSLGAKP